MIFWTNHRN